MCYGVQAKKQMVLQAARSRGDERTVARLRELINDGALVDQHFAYGFEHPKLVLYTDADPAAPHLMTWGLVPSWVKDGQQGSNLWNRTINARSETMFTKPAFRFAARARRALLYVNGFFEHHHFGGQAYPYFIRLRDRPWFALAALWEEWSPPDGGPPLRTFSIVTTRANALMRKIHNNPKMSGPRMPVILAEGEEDQWLVPYHSEADERTILALAKPFPAEAMEARTVAPLLGKQGAGNSEGVESPFEYPELALVDPLA